MLKKNDSVINKIISQKMEVLFNYLTKGKQIEKPLQSVHKFLRNSPFLLKSHLETYLNIIKKSKNKFLLEHSLDFLQSKLYFKNLTSSPDQVILSNILLKNFEEIIVNIEALKLIYKHTKATDKKGKFRYFK